MRFSYKNEFVQSLLISASYFVFWALALLISANGETGNFSTVYLYSAWQNLYVTLINLFIFHVLIGFIAEKKHKSIWITAGVVIVLFFISICYLFWIGWGAALSLFPALDSASVDTAYIVRGTIYILYGMAYFALIKSVIRSARLRIKNQQLIIEKKVSELNYLKSQTNPHFLFNTLNNIYSLSRTKSDLAADSILRLSDILRYMLYETQTDWVSISNEIKVMQDYLELEKIRYDISLKSSFTIELQNPDQLIPPLLMTPLIENAFKHGVSETKRSPFIDIQLLIRNNILRFEVINSIGEEYSFKKQTEGIGLKNLRRQLQLLFKEADLETRINGHLYTASLTINLDSYAKD